MDFQTSTYTIDRLVSLVRSGRLALPEFQRDFVWNPSKVVELLDSIARTWPVGSLLMLKGPQPFGSKEIDAGPPLRGGPEVFVLDGQQRITALYHAVADISDVVYFVDFDALSSGVQEAIQWRRRDGFVREFGGIKERAKRGIAKVREVSDNEEFYKWQSFLPTDRAREVLSLRESELAGLKSQVYRLPAIELEHEIDLEALARIFETINRTGVRLNAFDLMVAVLYPHGFKLRDEWESALIDHPLLKTFHVDGIEILKLIAIWVRRQQQDQGVKVTVRGIRQGDVLAVPPKDVRLNWQRAVSSYERALSALVGRFGVVSPSIAPPPAMVLAMAAFCDVAKETAIDSRSIASWYWASIRSQSYSQGANTRAVSDVDRILKGDPDQIENKLIEFSDLTSEPVRRNRILANGICALLAQKGARDLLTGELLSAGGEGEIVYRSISNLADGSARADERVSVSSLVFAREKSFLMIASKVRNGHDFRRACDQLALGSQFVDDTSLIGDYRSRSLRLSKLLMEAEHAE